MPLTRDFKTTIKARADRDPTFRAALYAEAITALIEGDTATAKAMLRDYVNATIGFERLEAVTGTPRKSLMRMLSTQGNPTLDNLGLVLQGIKAETKLQLDLQVA